MATRSVPVIEAYVESAAQAEAAVAAGATRLELCGPGEGGLTPSASELDAVRAQSQVPVHVMIRPRAGDFLYDAAEFELMRLAIAAAVGAGADGVVFGVLRADSTIDVPRMAELVALARPLVAVCHRAFDATPDADEARGALLALGMDGVLTSGHAPKAIDGVATLTRHIAAVGRSGAPLEVIAGGSVRAENARALVNATGVRAVHARGTDPHVIAELARELR